MKPTLLIAAVGVALAAFVGYNFIYAPQRNQVGLIRGQIAEERATQQRQAEVAGLLEQLERYRKRLPQEPDPSWLVREAVELTEKVGVQVTTITPDAPKTLGQFTRLGVALQVIATYHQLGNLLDEIERSEHFLQVERMTVSRADEGRPASVSLTLSTLYVPRVLNLHDDSLKGEHGRGEKSGA